MLKTNMSIMAPSSGGKRRFFDKRPDNDRPQQSIRSKHLSIIEMLRSGKKAGRSFVNLASTPKQ